MPSLKQARRFASTDGAGLAILGTLATFRGLAYTPLATTASVRSSHVMESWMPLWAWSGVWLIIAAICVYGAFRWRGRVAGLALGMTVGLHFLFGASFLWGTISGESPRGWVSALSYLTIAALAVWAFARGRREDGMHPGEVARDSPH